MARGLFRPNQRDIKMKKLLLASAISSAFAAPVAVLAADSSPHTLTGNVSLVSDYRFRGISQTFKEPAIQGGFDYSHSSGFYAGTWASNVYGNGAAIGNPIYQGASMEWDFYGGYKFERAGLGFDLGLLQYYYPNGQMAVPAKNKFDYLEAYLGVTWKFLTAKYSHGLKDYFGVNQNAVGAAPGFCGVSSSGTALTAATATEGCAGPNGGSKGSGYLDVTATFEVRPKLNLIAHVGHQSVKNYDKFAYTDWKLGATYEWAGLTWGAAYVDTNAKEPFYRIGETTGGGTGVTTRTVSDSTVVLSVAKTF
jgi:uncharacterized protein (TIGR02001 family)